MNNGSGPVRLIQEPGAGFLYSGGGCTVLQLLVEEVTREPFAPFMEREVLRPLGMTRSAYHWRDDLRGLPAGAYGSEAQRLPNYLFAEQAAASLYSTGPDLARSPAPAAGGGYGLAVEIWPVSQNIVVGHGGANQGWKTRWVALQARGLGLVVLTNGDTDNCTFGQSRRGGVSWQ